MLSVRIVKHAIAGRKTMYIYGEKSELEALSKALGFKIFKPYFDVPHKSWATKVLNEQTHIRVRNYIKGGVNNGSGISELDGAL